MARRAGLLRNRLNERTLLSWAQTNESFPTTDSSSPVIAVMQPAHALLANHCTVFQRACPASRRLLCPAPGAFGRRDNRKRTGRGVASDVAHPTRSRGRASRGGSFPPNARRPHFARDSESRYGPVSCSASASRLALPSHTSRHGRVGEIWARNRRDP